ncbi:MAG: class I SAM-dependent methyltransferase [Rhodospirillales bacterium CG15_BIG_FIL_POST_REV_8_21_14_020_66_15]|nr:MAG: class I SAM-dependent methyltransferase [Rhodospirillales bacterium CG15_BIG_FIL_POST_REV_8_21_14_020_66_15]
MTDGPAHWNGVYAARGETELTWYEEQPVLSYELAAKYAKPGEAVIDIGGGAARLVDRLVAGGHGPVTVLDISEAALRISRDRLGESGAGVTWVAADVRTWVPPRRYALWHDRAVFHFLTEARDRAAYVAAMDRALAPGGAAIIATFDADGPETCSGLPVARYAPEDLARALEDLAPGRFRPLESRRHVHETPKGRHQAFQVSVFTKDKD